jgi:predicted AlkP superfamily pyrophosphatase or phosphodiesterase
MAQDGPPRNIILVGWDGAQRAHVKECLARKELPTLQKLIDEGTMVDIDITTGATDTKAGWTQILTGYKPDITGVWSNARYKPVAQGWSVFERLRAHFGADKIATLAAIGKARHCGEIDPPVKERIDAATTQAAADATGAKGGKGAKGARGAKGGKAIKQPGAKPDPFQIVEENGVKYRVRAGSPYFGMHQQVDVWDFALMQDEKVGTRAIELVEKYKDKPMFFFVHFAEVDHKGHKAGENSKDYNDALISNDTWTGKIIQKLKDLKLYEQTILYVTADHGFDEAKTGHGKAPSVFLATNDRKVSRSGDRADITPTILDRFGVDLSQLKPPLSGKSLLGK